MAGIPSPDGENCCMHDNKMQFVLNAVEEKKFRYLFIFIFENDYGFEVSSKLYEFCIIHRHYYPVHNNMQFYVYMYNIHHGTILAQYICPKVSVTRLQELK